jgi:hypothetical protein
MANPCGFSIQDVSRIIKENVLPGGYNNRSEVLKGLMNDPALRLTYAEAKEITDYYYTIYRKVAGQNKKPAIVKHLTGAQKAQVQIDNLVLDYLSGRTSGVPMTQADTDHLLKLYERADVAETPTLKGKLEEEANIFVSKFNPMYANELFRSSVYARPLLSGVFFIKSFLSNLHAHVERSITDSLWDGKKMDFTSLIKFDGLANASFFNVVRGGIPATTIAHNEQFDFSKGRPEEFDLKGTNIEGSKYYRLMKFYTQWSNRFTASPDTRGIYSNAERHMYQLLKEEYRAIGRTELDATQLALQDMELDDVQTSVDMAIETFTKLGLPIYNSKGKQTSEFKVAVQEYMRRHRDKEVWAKALELSKNDFWKRNMTVKSEMGFGDYGVFGLKAQLFTKLRSALESKTKKKVTSAFQLWAFGFVNGAANFAEDAIERIPLYAAVKLAFLQARKKNITDAALAADIQRRQKDIIVKTTLTAAFFLAARMAEKLLCPEDQDKVSGRQISEGRTQLGICGIPAFVPPQMMVAYKVYNILNQAGVSDEEYFDTVLNILPVVVQSNEMGLGGTIDKIADGASEYAVAEKTGNEVKKNEIRASMTKNIVRGGVDYANTFIPLPSRLMNEAATLTQFFRGQTARQQSLNIAVDDKGTPTGWLNSLGKTTIASLGNVTGINEIAIAAIGSDKPYAMDWQGRPVAQLRGSDIFGSGVQYNENDELLIEAGVPTPYVNRLQKIEYAQKKTENFGVVLTEKNVRYMTDDEFYNVSKALSEFNKKYFDKNRGKLARILEQDKTTASAKIKNVFARTKNAAIEAVEKGLKSPLKIQRYIERNWESKRMQSITRTDY